MLLCEFPDGKNSDRREKLVTACTRLAICTQAEHSWVLSAVACRVVRECSYSNLSRCCDGRECGKSESVFLRHVIDLRR